MIKNKKGQSALFVLLKKSSEIGWIEFVQNNKKWLKNC